MLHTQSGSLGHAGDSVVGLHCLEDSDMRSVLDAFHGWLYQRWRNLPSDPRVAGSDTVVHANRESWFAAVPFDEFDCARPQSFVLRMCMIQQVFTRFTLPL
jgi:hypothetical protein